MATPNGNGRSHLQSPKRPRCHLPWGHFPLMDHLHGGKGVVFNKNSSLTSKQEPFTIEFVPKEHWGHKSMKDLKQKQTLSKHSNVTGLALPSKFHRRTNQKMLTCQLCPRIYVCFFGKIYPHGLALIRKQNKSNPKRPGGTSPFHRLGA